MLVQEGEVRLRLDGAPGFVVPARVTYVASSAQFTPKSVETASERQKLMFRVKAQVDRLVLLRYADHVPPASAMALAGLALLAGGLEAPARHLRPCVAWQRQTLQGIRQLPCAGLVSLPPAMRALEPVPALAVLVSTGLVRLANVVDGRTG